MLVEVKLIHRGRLYRKTVNAHSTSSAGPVVLRQLPMFWKPEDITIINCIGYCRSCRPLSLEATAQCAERINRSPK